MAEYTTQRMFFFALLFLVTLAFFWLIRGFMQPIFWAVALGIIVYPAHAQLVQRLNNRPSLAAITSVITVVLLVILPLIGIGAAVTSEATALYGQLNPDDADTAAVDGGPSEGAEAPPQQAEDQPQPQQLDLSIEAVVAWAREHIPGLGTALDTLGVDAAGLDSQLASAAGFVSEFVASRALALGQNTLRMALYFFLMLYLLFFFLRDGTRLLDGLVRALPLGDARERLLLERFAQVARATIKGTLVVGIVQGTIGGITFAVLGLGAPVLWGVLMALLSILPAIGPAVVWIPAAIILFVDDRYIAGIALVLIGVLVIGLVDNVLRPILVGRDTRMPDYLVLLSTLGGLAAFGLAGIVIGPIIAAFFLSVWEMAQADFEHEEAAARADKRRALRTPAADAAHDAAGVEAAPAPAMLGRGGAPTTDNDNDNDNG